MSTKWQRFPQTTSDSFYFVGDELVMHNKAEYSYKYRNPSGPKSVRVPSRVEASRMVPACLFVCLFAPVQGGLSRTLRWPGAVLTPGRP